MAFNPDELMSMEQKFRQGNLALNTVLSPDVSKEYINSIEGIYPLDKSVIKDIERSTLNLSGVSPMKLLEDTLTISSFLKQVAGSGGKVQLGKEGKLVDTDTDALKEYQKAVGYKRLDRTIMNNFDVATMGEWDIYLTIPDSCKYAPEPLPPYINPLPAKSFDLSLGGVGATGSNPINIGELNFTFLSPMKDYSTMNLKVDILDYSKFDIDFDHANNSYFEYKNWYKLFVDKITEDYLLKPLLDMAIQLEVVLFDRQGNLIKSNKFMCIPKGYTESYTIEGNTHSILTTSWDFTIIGVNEVTKTTPTVKSIKRFYTFKDYGNKSTSMSDDQYLGLDSYGS